MATTLIHGAPASPETGLGSDQNDDLSRMSSKHGLARKVIIPLAVIFGLGATAIGYIVPRLLASNVVEYATASAEETVAQFKTLRKYYVKNVISKVVGKSDVTASTNHADAERTIPLPATLIHDLSEQLKDRGTSLQLYSAFPFPNRSTRGLDEFQTDA